MTSALLTSFNSMKVRLKQVIVNYTNFADRFQFHEGPIKTLRRKRKYRPLASVSIP